MHGTDDGSRKVLLCKNEQEHSVHFLFDLNRFHLLHQVSSRDALNRIENVLVCRSGPFQYFDFKPAGTDGTAKKGYFNEHAMNEHAYSLAQARKVLIPSATSDSTCPTFIQYEDGLLGFVHHEPQEDEDDEEYYQTFQVHHVREVEHLPAFQLNAVDTTPNVMAQARKQQVLDWVETFQAERMDHDNQDFQIKALADFKLWGSSTNGGYSILNAMEHVHVRFNIFVFIGYSNLIFKCFKLMYVFVVNQYLERI